MIKKLLAAILAFFYLSISELGKKPKKKSNRIVWEGKPERWPYALSCKMSIIMGLMACVIPLIFLLIIWDPWGELKFTVREGGVPMAFAMTCMLIGLLVWGLKVSIGRVIYRYWTSPDVRYTITESEIIKKVKDRITRISRDDIYKVVVSQSKIFKGVGTVSFVTDDFNQKVPVGTDYPVELSEDDIKNFALTFYGVRDLDRIKDLVAAEHDDTIAVETFKPIDNAERVRPIKFPTIIGPVLMGGGILIAPMVPVVGVPMAIIGTFIIIWYATVGRED